MLLWYLSQVAVVLARLLAAHPHDEQREVVVALDGRQDRLEPFEDPIGDPFDVGVVALADDRDEILGRQQLRRCDIGGSIVEENDGVT